MIKIKNLSKRYKDNEYHSAVDINLECFKGEIVGLVGSNGAGKSTILKCLVGALSPDSGNITICDIDINKEPKKAKQKFAFVSDNHAVFEEMTGREYINFMADMYSVSLDDRKARLEKLEGLFKLGSKLDNLISSYSFGMKQKACIMGALIYEPSVWVLDEPFTGLDLEATLEVEKIMREYAERGGTVLFSSHDLHIVERLCNKIYMVRKGYIVDSFTMDDFKKKNKGATLEDYFINKVKGVWEM